MKPAGRPRIGPTLTNSPDAVVDPEVVRALAIIDDWPVATAGAGVVLADGTKWTYGTTERPFALASVTKPLVALSTLVAVEEGSLDLDQASGPPGSTIRHLLAHASGLAPDSDAILAPPATRRIYSNRGFELLGDALAAATGLSIRQYLNEALVDPLELSVTDLHGSPASGAHASVEDLVVVAHELLVPTLISRTTLQLATTVAFPGLDGVLPGFGRQSPNDWGLGFELRDAKTPHWTGATNSPTTFGHFGQSGTMLWVDPIAGVALVCLTDRAFGPWAAEAWPSLSRTVLAEATGEFMERWQ
jgi:CubicO group peptidase (beta-lactamase class C family)